HRATSRNRRGARRFPNACPNHQHPTYPVDAGIKHGPRRSSGRAYADRVTLPGRIDQHRVPQPMLATGGELPTGAGWAYELNWDGVRALAVVAQGRQNWRLFARSGAEITAGYPELGPLAAALRAADID